jgi:hypothetical protein
MIPSRISFRAPSEELSFTQKSKKLLHCQLFPLLRTGRALPPTPTPRTGAGGPESLFLRPPLPFWERGIEGD